MNLMNFYYKYNKQISLMQFNGSLNAVKCFLLIYCHASLFLLFYRLRIISQHVISFL